MIYFIKTVGHPYVKIGYSLNPGTRINLAKVFCPFPVEVLGIFAGSQQTEQNLHKRFETSHFRGEWFCYTEEIAAYLEKQKS